MRGGLSTDVIRTGIDAHIMKTVDKKKGLGLRPKVL